METPFHPSQLESGAALEVHHARLGRVETSREISDLAFQVYGGLFVLGAAILLISLFLPRRKVLSLRGWRDPTDLIRGPTMSRTSLAFSGACLLLLLLCVSIQLGVDENRGFIADQPRKMERAIKEAEKRGEQAREEIARSHYLYLPQTNVLKYVSLGNEAIAADYMWLSSLQYVSSPFRRGHKFDLLHRFYAAVIELEPNWVEAQIKAGKILSALDPDRYRTEKFFQKAMVLNPENYEIPLEAGRLFVVPPADKQLAKDYSDRAAFYFKRSLVPKKKAPQNMRAALRDLIGRLQTEAGQHVEAARQLRGVASDEGAPMKIREQSSRQWLYPESLFRADVFEAIVKEYRTAQGHWPVSLPQALDAMPENQKGRFPKWLDGGRSGGQPLDAYGMPLLFNPSTGEVASKGALALFAIQKVGVLESLASYFRNENGRYPLTPNELTQYARKNFGNYRETPFAIREALGDSLDCEVNPLGTTWDYDSSTGKFLLPADCQARVLYRNERAAIKNWVPPYFASSDTR